MPSNHNLPLRCFVVIVALCALVVQGHTVSAEALSIGNQKQLLVDDHVVAQREHVERVLGTVTKHGVVLRPTPGLDEGGFFAFYHTVAYNQKEGKFQIWYNLGNAFDHSEPYVGTGYAESDDGIHWTKPLVSADGKSNKVLPASGLAVMIDPTVPWGAEDKFKVAYQHNKFAGGSENAVRLAYSPDGIRWKDYNDGKQVTHRAADTQNQIIWDPLRQKYRVMTRSDNARPREPEFRTVRIMYHDDNNLLRHPTAWKIEKDRIAVDGPESAEEKYYPDSQTQRRQFHHMTCWIYEGIYFGLMNVWDTPLQKFRNDNDFFTRHEQDVSEFYIGTSRDGLQFDKTWVHARQPLVPRGPAGGWDKDLVAPGSNIVTHGDRHWIYYHGGNERIWNITPQRDCFIGLATLPLDRFVAMAAGAQPGFVVTKPFELTGNVLELNVEGSDGGEVTVEVLDESARPIDGYWKAAAITYSSVDELRLRPKWGTGNDLSLLNGQIVRLKFSLRRAKLYAFRVIDELE